MAATHESHGLATPAGIDADLPDDHPLDVVERMATGHDWLFKRENENELSISVSGGSAAYDIGFTWLADIQAIHVDCGLDLNVPTRRQAAMFNLLALVNAQIWIGHFDIWPNEGAILFRHALPLNEGAAWQESQAEMLLVSAVTACERYYQAFQLVIGSRAGAGVALDAAMMETRGEA